MSNLLKMMAGSAVAPLYVDDVFSTYLYTGNGSTQTITNGIDLAGKGGLVWCKSRSGANPAQSHMVGATALGVSGAAFLRTNTTDAAYGNGTQITAFGSTGFSLGAYSEGNAASTAFVSWSFRDADKFHAHTTVTKSSGSNATVSFANLGTLGMVRVKRTDASGSWYIWHRSLSAGQLLIGETTAAAATLGHVTVSGTTVTLVNGVIADGTYLVEAFAHDTTADGLIQCGSYTGTGAAGNAVNLGFEPQFLILKNASSGGTQWVMLDSMRGLTVGNDAVLLANSSGAELSYDSMSPTATGFVSTSVNDNTNGHTYIYLAIRRPNKPPTSGTQVYNAIARTGTGAAATVTGVGFAPDLVCDKNRDQVDGAWWHSRLAGFSGTSARVLTPSSTGAEFNVTSANSGVLLDGDITGTIKVTTGGGNLNASGINHIIHFFRRAPGVQDQICYTGTGANKTEAHNLTVAPELWLVKGRSGATEWVCGSSLLANTEKIVMPSPNGKVTDATAWNSTYPTATLLSLGTAAAVNTTSATYTAYLWATLAGISKVFSYTGDGGSGKVIDCGFSAGARFVMIIRTTASTAQDIFIWDSVRGIVAGTDPHLSLNTTAAEVTTDDSIDPDSSGFAVNQLAATNINVTSAVYIGLAIA